MVDKELPTPAPTPKPKRKASWPPLCFSTYWRRKFAGGFVYKGYCVKQFPDGLWWRWNGTAVGVSLTKADAKAAADQMTVSYWQRQQTRRGKPRTMRTGGL